MARIDADPTELRMSSEQLHAVGHGLGALRTALGRLEAAGGEGETAALAAAAASLEERWAASIGAMQYGTAQAGRCVVGAADAYELVDRHAMPSPGGG